ncbi:MAG TPA: type II secretion system protein [Pirellulales bacterium]|nr:type II secretion system protein [Pirellulales bacterium]
MSRSKCNNEARAMRRQNASHKPLLPHPPFGHLLPRREGLGRRRAFTLVELIVVLAILTALTAVAVQSLGPVADQARYESTVRALSSVRDAIVTLSPTAVAGFLVDVGRPPLNISELLYQPDPSTISPFNSTGALPFGWNGPYVLPPVSTNSTSQVTLCDAWAQPININSEVLLSTNSLPIWSNGNPANAGGSPIALNLPLSSMAASVLTVYFASSATSSSTTGVTATLSYPTPLAVHTTSATTTSSNMLVFSPTISSSDLTCPLWVGPRVINASVSISGQSTPTSLPAVYFTLRPGQNVVTVNVP